MNRIVVVLLMLGINQVKPQSVTDPSGVPIVKSETRDWIVFSSGADHLFIDVASFARTKDNVRGAFVSVEHQLTGIQVSMYEWVSCGTHQVMPVGESTTLTGRAISVVNLTSHEWIQMGNTQLEQTLYAQLCDHHPESSLKSPSYVWTSLYYQPPVEVWVDEEHIPTLSTTTLSAWFRYRSVQTGRMLIARIEVNCSTHQIRTLEMFVEQHERQSLIKAASDREWIRMDNSIGHQLFNDYFCVSG